MGTYVVSTSSCSDSLTLFEPSYAAFSHCLFYTVVTKTVDVTMNVIKYLLHTRSLQQVSNEDGNQDDMLMSTTIL